MTVIVSKKVGEYCVTVYIHACPKTPSCAASVDTLGMVVRVIVPEPEALFEASLIYSQEKDASTLIEPSELCATFASVPLATTVSLRSWILEPLGYRLLTTFVPLMVTLKGPA